MTAPSSAPSPASAPQDVRRSQGDAIVVGGSLAGLMTALALSRQGLHVTVIERSDDTGRTGAALHVGSGLLQSLTGRRRGSGREVATGIQTWVSVYAGLRAEVLADPGVDLVENTTVDRVGQDEATAWAKTPDGRTFTGDVVVGADGHRSVVRREIAPGRPDATFAGYVIWLGLVAEGGLDGAGRFPTDTAFLSGGDYHLLGYPLPGPAGSTVTGRRQLGWAWYDAGHNALLRSTGAVVDGVVQRSLKSADIPDAVYEVLGAQARKLWPQPWREAVLDCVRRRSIIGTPIAEYVPERLVDGRLCLVGDAAHVPTPMTGNGFSASMRDAEVLAEAFANRPAGLKGPAALAAYQDDRLQAVRSLVRSGQDFSRDFRGGRA